MFIYKYNKYTGKYYSYDTDFYDIFTPMFDETIHPQDDNFDVHYGHNPVYHLTCAFCNTTFPNRSQLFKHLGYMGINIHNAPAPIPLAPMDEEKGDFGFSLESVASSAHTRGRRSRIRRKTFKAIQKRRRQRENRRQRRRLMNTLKELEIRG